MHAIPWFIANDSRADFPANVVIGDFERGMPTPWLNAFTTSIVAKSPYSSIGKMLNFPHPHIAKQRVPFGALAVVLLLCRLTCRHQQIFDAHRQITYPNTSRMIDSIG